MSFDKGGLMHGIKIPPRDFGLKMQGGGGAYARGGAYLRDYGINGLYKTVYLQCIFN